MGRDIAEDTVDSLYSSTSSIADILCRVTQQHLLKLAASSVNCSMRILCILPRANLGPIALHKSTSSIRPCVSKPFDG